MEIHEVCNIFPSMSEEDLKYLITDIVKNGQLEPIWTYQGKVIDGRNRMNVCRIIGIEPKTREWDGKGSILDFVLSMNLHRRQLTKSQRAAVAVEVERMKAEELAERKATLAREQAAKQQRDGGAFKADNRIVAILPQSGEAKPEPTRARDEAAKAFGTSPRYVQEAKAIARASPEIHAKVKAGELSIPEAKRELGGYSQVLKRGDCYISVSLGRDQRELLEDIASLEGVSVAEMTNRFILDSISRYAESHELRSRPKVRPKFKPVPPYPDFLEDTSDTPTPDPSSRGKD